MNFKQLAADRITEPRSRFDLAELLRRALRTFSRASRKRASRSSSTRAEGIAMESYPMALTQVVTNLGVNALQHAFEPGLPGARVTVRAALAAGDEVVIEIGDNGRGIDPALRSRVFEPFFTTRRMLGGSGLGLYIVDQIVTRQLAGTVTLEDNPGGGARFVVRVPRIARHVPNVGRILAARPGSRTNES